MKIALSIVGVLLVLAGGVWFLQGINILPGSFWVKFHRAALQQRHLVLENIP